MTRLPVLTVLALLMVMLLFVQFEAPVYGLAGGGSRPGPRRAGYPVAWQDGTRRVMPAPLIAAIRGSHPVG